MKSEFESGTMEELNEAVTFAYFARASEYVGKTKAEAFKLAEKDIKQKFTNLRPIRESLNPAGKPLIGDLDVFLLSLNEDQLFIALNTWIEYEKKFATWKNQYKYYDRSQGIDEFAKRFDWDIDTKYKKALQKLIKQKKHKKAS